MCKLRSYFYLRIRFYWESFGFLLPPPPKKNKQKKQAKCSVGKGVFVALAGEYEKQGTVSAPAMTYPQESSFS